MFHIKKMATITIQISLDEQLKELARGRRFLQRPQTNQNRLSVLKNRLGNSDSEGVPYVKNIISPIGGSV